MTTEIIRPNANGDLQEALYQFPDSSAHWDKVDDVDADDAVTFVYYDAAHDYQELYHFPTPSEFSLITSVTVYVRDRKTNPYEYGNEGWALIKTWGVVYPQLVDFGVPWDWVTKSYSWTTNPNTTLAWTNAELAALQAGFKGVSGASFGAGVYLSQVYVEIAGNLIQVTTDPASNITPYSAQLNGTLVEDASDTPVQCSFEWGLTTDYGNTTLSESVAESATFLKVIGNNLVPGTTYHFRAKAVGASGATVYGADRTFGASIPTDTLARVTGLVHRWSAGPNPVYQLEVILGGLSSQYFSPIGMKTPEPTIPLEATTTPLEATTTPLRARQPTLRDFINWLASHTHEEQVAIFGAKAVTFSRWSEWYMWRLRAEQGF